MARNSRKPCGVLKSSGAGFQSVIEVCSTSGGGLKAPEGYYISSPGLHICSEELHNSGAFIHPCMNLRANLILIVSINISV
jgi:hypothetical protein